jgi:hypothetical protein
MQNLHAVLVHESRESVIDLVRNLHHLDPSSNILLYNGGTDSNLLDPSFSWAKYNAVVHPSPKRMKWGWLHEFALDCMRFGLAELPFDTMTIVDSDQLGLRAGYSEFIAARLAGRARVGMLGSAAPPVPGKGAPPPAAQAYKEFDLWRPFLRRFERGEAKFVHWTFWPSTVFTADAARALLGLWPDPQLQEILTRTKIWASEEVILPTLVALLGFSVEINPCRHDCVRYRVRYTPAQLDAAMANAETFWVHPIARRYDDPLRVHVRRRLASYEGAEGGAPVTRLEDRREAGLLLTLPILNEIRPLEGWLSDEEADLLIATAARALRGEGPRSVVEVGSYCGKATIALARVAQAVQPSARIAAIDLHDGVVGSRDGSLHKLAPSREKLQRNLQQAGLLDRVAVYQARSIDVAWDAPIHFLLVDGLHDYASVAADFGHFASSLTDDAFVAFHDYAEYFPGVKLFVDELLRSGRFARVRLAGSLIVLRRSAAAAAGVTTAAPDPASVQAPEPVVPALDVPPDPVRAPAAELVRTSAGLISCIMPTADRRQFVPHAIRHFLAQDYPERELVIVDDGRDAVGDLIPDDARVRYIRLSSRHSIGEKRNIACRAARGGLIAHWDDDDWMATGRLSQQVTDLEREAAAIAGLTSVYYFEPASGRAWQYRYPQGGRRWVAGNSLMYRKAHWQKHPFADVNIGEDARFVWADRSTPIHVHADSRFFVAMIHPTNVGKKQVKGRFWQPEASESIAALMGADFDVYQQLLGGGQGRSATG